MTRSDGRTADQLRPITFERGWLEQAEGSTLVSFGRTRVLCTASFTAGVPRWLKDSGNGKARNADAVAGFEFGADGGNDRALLSKSLASSGCFIELEYQLSAHRFGVDASGFEFGWSAGIDRVVATFGCGRDAKLRA